ncbi:hydroxyacid oxidase 1-like, partial [Stegodyphus dumicola]|uniref:hydroxyacid oxidase 1-like n=1 Tax=Stegodyphus dumicola TaxID=202533 RepID=UPI0015B2189C
MSSFDEFVCLDDFEKYALKVLSKKVADYYASGANHQQTLCENCAAFSRLRFRPRCLNNVSIRNPRTEVLGKPVSFPVGIAPSAMQRMAHPEGEIATVKGAASEAVIMILSTLSTTSLEDVAEAAPSSNRWFQLYIYKDRNTTKNLVARAEKAGYSALVLTVDTPVFGNRLADTRNRFSLPPHLRLANFDYADIKCSIPATATDDSNLNKYVN